MNISSSEEETTPHSPARSKAPSSPHAAATNYYRSYLKAPSPDLKVSYASSKLKPKADAKESDRKQLRLGNLAMDKLKSPVIRS